MARALASARGTATNRSPLQDKSESLNINGTTFYATSPVIPGTTGFCMAMWINPGGAGNQDSIGNHIVDWETASNTDGFRLCLGVSPLKATFTVNSGASSTVSISTPDRSNPKGSWYHFAMTFKPNEAKLYVNGVLIGTDTNCAMTVATGQSVTFGLRSFTTATPRVFIGDYKEIVMQNTTTPWTQTQIEDMYYRSANPSNLTAYYPLNGDLLDHSGNNNHLTATYSNYPSFANRVPSQHLRRKPTNGIVDITADVTTGNAGGWPIEINATTFIRCAGREIYQSTDSGSNWVLKYTSPGTQDDTGLVYRAKNGNLFVGYSNRSIAVVNLVRSTDNGATWSVVLTSESTSWRYYIAESTIGDLYIAEYSLGDQDATELYGYNVWKSTNSGASWSKFYTAPQQSTPGAKDGIRHLHYVFCDSDDQLYVGFGDIGFGFASPAGKSYKLGNDGVLGDELRSSTNLPEGNGMIGAVEMDNGKILFIGDLYPYQVYIYDKVIKKYESRNNIGFGLDSSSDPSTWHTVKGKDGVVYVLSYGVSGKIAPVIFASGDDGLNWKTLRFTNNTSLAINIMSLNRNYVNSRLYIQVPNSNFYSIPDYTRAQLAALGVTRTTAI